MSAINQKDWVLRYSPPLTPSFSLPPPHYSTDFEKESSTPSSFSKISPVLILVIIILAVIFFVCGILHLLVRYLKKSSPFSPIYDSNRYPDTSGAHHSLQRQLQQLFRLHDSGLDQSLIDALPVFYFRDIVGLKEQFDCAVCLSEFSDQDKLRLLPICSHAFHIHCIDTWLLSNSTCPLCRGTLIGSSGLPIGNPPFNFNISSEIPNGFHSNGENNISSDRNLGIIEESGSEAKRVFSVRLGKFRSLNCCESSGVSSICNLDARRCYSMGAFQYVVGDSNLQVTQSSYGSGIGDRCSSSIDVEEKKISGRTRGDSFSVSKIWLWSKKNRFPSSSNSAHLGRPSCVDDGRNVHAQENNRDKISGTLHYLPLCITIDDQ